MIWGAAGGIGQSILKLLKSEGWNNIAIARDTGDIDSLATHAFDASLDNPAVVEQTAFLISQEVDSVDLWIYAAGDILSAKADQMTPDEWQGIISANLSGAFYTFHYSLPLLSENAHIVFLGAVSERLRLPGFSAYAAAKAGLEAFATALGKEQRKRRITVVRPGAVATSLWDKVPLRLPADAASPEKVAQRIFEAYQEGHKGQLDLV